MAVLTSQSSGAKERVDFTVWCDPADTSRFLKYRLKMKTKEKLQAVTEDIRIKLPRLMELEKGCVISYKFYNKMYSSELEILNIDKDVVWVQDCSSAKVFMITNRELAISTIIGKEPTILDCLEYLKEEIPNRTFLISGNGELLSYDNSQYIDLEDLQREGVNVDLSKPLLKDNEELINFLYGLL